MPTMKPNNERKKLLFERLAAKGLAREMIHSYIRSMRICYVSDPKMPSLQTNRKMQSLGWYNVELDDRTLKQSITYFETENRCGSTQLKEIKGINEKIANDIKEQVNEILKQKNPNNIKKKKKKK